MRKSTSQPPSARVQLAARRGPKETGEPPFAARTLPAPAVCSRARVWPPRVVLRPPLLDHDLRLPQRIENLSVQTFIPQLPVATFAVAVRPWAARLDVQRPGARLRQPLPHSFGYEFRSVASRERGCFS